MKGFPLPDGRGWVAIACFILVVVVLAMLAAIPPLRDSEFFRVISTALIVSAWIGGPVGWAFQATQAGGELTKRTADLADKQNDALAASIPAPAPDPAPTKR